MEMSMAYLDYRQKEMEQNEFLERERRGMEWKEKWLNKRKERFNEEFNAREINKQILP